jgi:SAM-dependent methyltransferase
MTIATPRNQYVSAHDFRDRTLTLGADDPDRKLYPDDNETLVWMMQQAAEWSKFLRPRILEVGCGHGRWAKHLERAYSTYLGVDPVMERTASAWTLYGTARAEFMHEADPLSGSAAMYNHPDIVFAVDVLQHLGMDEAIHLVSRIARILPVGGKFITWDGCLGRYSMEEAERRYVDRPEHMIPKPLSEFERLIPDLTWTTVDGTRLVAVKG